MTPYYEHKGITIYHGDCREIMSEVSAHACVSDPPYGIGWQTDYSQLSSSGTRNHPAQIKTYKLILGDAEKFDPSHLLKFQRLALWGANHFSRLLPDNGTWLIWDKRDLSGNAFMSEAEAAWMNKGNSVRLVRHCWQGFSRSSENSEHYHPTQKPVVIMEWVICQATELTDTILDPYMGSGTTLIAAKKLGHSAIGIEIEEKYCEIAAKRLSQEVFDFSEVNS